jgi:hypothetical protein
VAKVLDTGCQVIWVENERWWHRIGEQMLKKVFILGLYSNS